MSSSVGPPNSDLQSSQQKREPLAVIGIGCRLPAGIDSPEAFWDGLLKGVDGICDVPEDRWRHERFHDTNKEKFGCIRNAKGGFIEGVDQFDGEFFGHFPTESQRMDPQERLLLEVTHEAMEDAGLRRDQFDGSRTAVFVGSFMYDYHCMQAASEQRDQISPYVAMGTMLCSLANRVSYDFNLKGPSVSLDTACSSSLTALHLACQSLWCREADMAVAGGVNVMLRPESSIILSKGGFLNPDQHCKAFDESANGYVRSEGVAAVILKPLSKALADGDSVYACVLGTGVNQDGFLPEGFTVPNPYSQRALLEAVYSEAGVDPATVSYVETHGPGTPVGDPVESLALGSVLGLQRSEEQPNLIIGSVKTNLGHLEGTAGVAGFIKGVLTAQHRVAPPNLHFHKPNPEIDFDTFRLEVPTRPMSLLRDDGPVIVGVNSFGAGGTNAHAVLQGLANGRPEYEKPSSTNGKSSEVATLYMLSSVHRQSLPALAMSHADYLSDTENSLDDVAFSAFTRRSHYPNLLAVVGDTTKELEEQLRNFADGQVDPAILTTTVKRRREPKLGFVFSGQGGQWARMGLQLMEREAVFRQCIEEIDRLFQELAGWSLLGELRKDKDDSRVNDTVVVQPTVMAIQIALVKLYERYGIRPSATVGHSIGEVAAAFAAGALTLEQAVQVIYHRSQAQDRASGKGGMLAVGLSFLEANEIIEGYHGRVSIGAVNGPEMLTLSGDKEPLRQIAETLESRGVFSREVRVQVAYHSHHMDAIKEIMLESLADIQGVQAKIRLYSTVTGRREKGTHLGTDYWYQNVRQPVMFTDALSSMVRDGFDTFVEVGPHPVLIRGGEALFQKLETDAMMAHSMTRREPEVTVFLQSLALLAVRGFEPHVEKMFGSGHHYVRLPKQPWQHSRHWFELPEAAEMRRGAFGHPFLKRQTQLVTEEGMAVWEATLGVHKFPYLRDHVVDGEIVFPATGHMELAWAVASEQYSHESFFLENLQFESPLILPDHSRYPLDVRLEVVSPEGDYRICSRPGDATAESPWTKHSSGRINTTHDRFEQSTASLSDFQKQFRDAEPVSVEQFYDYVAAAGLAYGENFRCIQQLKNHGNEWLAELELPDDLQHEAKRNNIHPALFDACVHVLFADSHRTGYPDRLYLPFRIDRYRIYGRPTKRIWAHVCITRNDEHFLNSDTLIFDENGELVAELPGLTGKRLVGAGSQQADSVYKGCYEYKWISTPRDAETHGRVFDTTRAVIIADSTGLVAGLAERFESESIETLVIPYSAGGTLDEQLADVQLDRRTLIVYAAGLSPETEQDGWKGLEHFPAIPSFLQLAQTLHKHEGVPRLFVVTNSAAGIAGDHRLHLGQAILHGMARVVNNECPYIPLKVIDLSAMVPGHEVDALYQELLHTRRDRDESEIALRDDDRCVRQLLPISRDIAEEAATSVEPGVGGYRAEMSVPGVLEQIDFRRLPPICPKEDEVEIEVEAAALDVRDALNGMGFLSEDAVAGGLTANRLGLAVAGRVVKASPSVEDVQVGDDVIARVPEGFCGRAVAGRHHLAPRPRTLTSLESTVIPHMYVAAYYSLCHIARVSPGETVLIHSAADGVGSAAIQLAKRRGAVVIATAETEKKREYLQELGIDQVFNYRSSDFQNCVLEVTSGRGVDIVFNSPSLDFYNRAVDVTAGREADNAANSAKGRLVALSLNCLAPFGRCIELGKSDVYRSSKLNLEKLAENISYFVVDVDRLALQKAEMYQQIMTEVVTLFENGELKPPKISEYRISDLPEAMRSMKEAYSGRVIVMNMQNDHVPVLPPRNAAFRPDRSYLISGGASGFGLEVARWMSARGARHLVLLSRSGPKSDADSLAIESMREQGVHVNLAQVDISDTAAVQSLVDRIAKDLPPLAGVIHGAAVMDDALIPAMTMERFRRVFGPKAEGAWNLHSATVAIEADLDFFLMFSSISSVMGLQSQVNYAAANYFLDSLAEFRRQQDLPATSINLGILGQYAGLSRNLSEERDVIGLLEGQGLLVIPLDDILAKLDAALVQKPAQRLMGRFDWSKFRLAYPQLVRDTRFLDVFRDAAKSGGGPTKSFDLRAELDKMEPDKRQELLEYEIRGKLSDILDASPDKLDVSESIEILGLDSLMLTDLQIWIGRLLDITLPLIKLLKGPSIATLAADLLTELAGTNATNASGKDAAEFTLADLDGVDVLNPWLIRGSGSVGAPCRLICFHSMGAGASLFTRFLVNPPDGYDILAVQTPGRENRSREPAAERIDELAEQIADELQPYFDRAVVIWGHSLGGIVAWEVTRLLRERYDLEPDHFMVTATAAPHLIEQHWKDREVLLKVEAEDNEAEYLITLLRQAEIDNEKIVKEILSRMRMDVPLVRSYRFHPVAPLACPITVFYPPLGDGFVETAEEVLEWAQYANRGFCSIPYKGGHWFLSGEEGRNLITETLKEIAAGLVTSSPEQLVELPGT